MEPISAAIALSQFAPSIIRFFTGSEKAASVAEKVVSIAQSVTGAQTPEQAFEMMKANAAMAADFQVKVLAADTELEKAHLFDVQNARAMQVAALGQDDLFSKRFVYYFASGWSIFAMVYFAAVTFYPLPPVGQRVADTILGVLITTVLGSISAYFFGSTKGSMEKTKLLAQSK